MLLASFAVLLTPRDIWHECSHDHDHSTGTESVLNIDQGLHSSFEFEEECFVCDFDLGLYTIVNPVFLSYLERAHSEDAFRLLSRLSDRQANLLSLRGPPVTV